MWSLSVALVVLASYSSVNVNVQAATITQRAILPRASLPSTLIGYYSSSGTYEAWDCRSGSTWQTASTWGKCCGTTEDCLMATTCVSDSVMVSGDFSSTCTGSKAQTKCVTGTVFRTIDDETPLMNYQCWPEWNGGNWKATRVTTVEPSTASSSASSASSASAASSPSSQAAKTTGTSSPTEETSTAQEPKKEKSKAWIAGPVVGGLIGAALFTFLGSFLYRRKVKKDTKHYLDRMAMEEKNSPVQSPGGDRYAYMHGSEGGVKDGGAITGGYMGHPPPLVEADQGAQRVEADQGYPVHELDGNAGKGRLPAEADSKGLP